MATLTGNNYGRITYSSVTATSAAGAAGADVIPLPGSYRAGVVECSSTSALTVITFFGVTGSSTGTKRALYTTTGGAVTITGTTLTQTALPAQLQGCDYFCMGTTAGSAALKLVLNS